jgi:hypothetical protein
VAKRLKKRGVCPIQLADKIRLRLPTRSVHSLPTLAYQTFVYSSPKFFIIFQTLNYQQMLTFLTLFPSTKPQFCTLACFHRKFLHNFTSQLYFMNFSRNIQHEKMEFSDRIVKGLLIVRWKIALRSENTIS